MGLAYDHSSVVNAIENQSIKNQWLDGSRGQRNLLVSTRWTYRDLLTSPDSLSTEAAGRVQLLLLLLIPAMTDPAPGKSVPQRNAAPMP